MRPRTIQAVALGMAVVVFGATAAQMPSINAQRKDLELVLNMDLGENAPPEIAITQLGLGAFRGLAMQVLFLRAIRLKDAGRYFDAKQLSDFIGELNPKYPAVWVFNSWNMAYNIGGCLPSGPERWLWVNNGINLLRQDAIKYNPNATELYRNLAWCFFHKIGAWSDYMHWYYKYRLAIESERIIGPDMSREAIERIAKAPATEAEFVKDPACAAILAEFKAQDITDAVTYCLLVEAYMRKSGGASSPHTIFDKATPFSVKAEEAKGVDVDRSPFSEDQLGLLDQDTDALAKLDAFRRRQRIADEFRMDPVLMAKLMDTSEERPTYSPGPGRDSIDVPHVGEIDWRTPEAHAIYWSVQGLSRAGDSVDTHAMNTARTVYQSLWHLATQGRIVYNPVTADIYIKPDLRFLDRLADIHIEMAKKFSREGSGKKDIYYQVYDQKGLFQQAHQNFLEQAIVLLFEYNQERKAGEYYAKIREWFPNPRYDDSLREFILKRLVEDVDSMNYNEALARADGFLVRAWNCVATGLEDQAGGWILKAKTMHDYYQKNVADPEQGDRTQLPPWDKVRTDSLIHLGAEWQKSDRGRVLLGSLRQRLPGAAKILDDAKAASPDRGAKKSESKAPAPVAP